jgi:hypothetical protein
MTNEELLGEVEDLLRTLPPRDTIKHSLEQNFAWFGRAGAVVEAWNPAQAIAFGGYLERFQSAPVPRDYHPALNQLLIVLHRARNDLRMKTSGPISTAIGQGMVFDYFDELRKIIEVARQDVFWVDPYLDAEFVSRYLSQVVPGVAIRLLARERLATLLPAVDAFSQQIGVPILVRSAPGFHDRYLFVDRTECYQSGASFKDGGRNAPTTLTQITDACAVVLQTYENLWASGNVER